MLSEYKDLFIVLALVLVLGGVYEKGSYDRGRLDTAEYNKVALKANQKFIELNQAMEKLNAEKLDKNLEYIDSTKDQDGAVAPILRNSLERLRSKP